MNVGAQALHDVVSHWELDCDSPDPSQDCKKDGRGLLSAGDKIHPEDHFNPSALFAFSYTT